MVQDIWPARRNTLGMRVGNTATAGYTAERPSANNMTNSELIEALRKNYIAYFRLFHGQHGIRVHVDEEAAWIIANGPPGNHILRANMPADHVDEGIDALLRNDSQSDRRHSLAAFPCRPPPGSPRPIDAKGPLNGKG